MSDSAALVQITSEIASAHLAKNHVPPSEIPALIASVHAAFAGLGALQLAVEPERPTPAVPIRKSVTDDYMVCLEGGKRFKSLRWHLRTKAALAPSNEI